jgi:hypothetical protein
LRDALELRGADRLTTGRFPGGVGRVDDSPDNGLVPTLDASIAALYKLPLGEFVAARNTLARTLKGADAARVRALQKPLVVPWVVNQLYWHAGPVYHDVMKAGGARRAAELAVLQGKRADVTAATTAHRRSVAEAAKAGIALAVSQGVHPPPDAVARMLELLSVAESIEEPQGRFTQPLQPAGFEALAGVAIKASPHAATSLSVPHAEKPTRRPVASAPRDRHAIERARREQAAAERRRRQALAKAEAAVSHAAAHERKARAEWEHAKQQLEDAERVVAGIRTADRSS